MLDVCESSFAGQLQMQMERFAALHWLRLARPGIVSWDVFDLPSQPPHRLLIGSTAKT